MLFGHGLWAAVSWIFNELLYPGALWWFGYVWGGILMGTLSCIICAGTLVYFERKGQDWVGAGALNELKSSDTSKRNIFVRLLAWALRKGDIFMFFLLSIFKDPFITTAYFTRGSFKGLNKKLWIIFGASTVIANAYWTFRCSALIALIKFFFFKHATANL
ncbi:MAG: hypothetical protein RLY57_227 [Candidatus Parcubacteria bacterium]|jgi:hypothetical protein